MNIPSLPVWITGPLLIIVSMVLAVTGIVFLRRTRWYPLLKGQGDFVNHIYTVIGIIYGVFLAFTMVIVWQQYSEAEHCITDEVTSISMLWRDAQVFPDSTRLSIQRGLLEYVDAVITAEWKSMGEGGWKSKAASVVYEKLWQTYYRFTPETQVERSFFDQSLSQLNEFGTQRRTRLMYSQVHLPLVLLIFMFIGGVVTTVFPYLFWTDHPRIQSILIAALAGLISSSLFLTLSLQYPYSGELGIKPDGFLMLKQSLIERSGQPHR